MSEIKTYKPERVTFENFAPYGDLIQAPPSGPSQAPSHLTINTVPNPIPGYKYNRVSPVISTYPASNSPNHPHPGQAEPVTAIFVFRATPPLGLKRGERYGVRMFERHACTTQAFVPMARGAGGVEGERLEGEDGAGMVVLVAKNGADDKPDMSTLKVFLTSPAQGVAYHAGIWHHSMLSLTPTDYCGIDTQITQNSSLKIDCEALRKGPEEEPYFYIDVPEMASAAGK